MFTVHCTLPVVHNSSPIAACSMFTVHNSASSLFTGHWPLFTAHSAHRFKFTVRCSLATAHAAHCPLPM
eukprot:2169942-Lingulodinium_polyedra.AAC.1